MEPRHVGYYNVLNNLFCQKIVWQLSPLDWFRWFSALSGAGENRQQARGRKRRRLYKSESDGFSSPPPPSQRSGDIRRPMEAKPLPVGIRTIGSFHGAMTNSRLNQHFLQASFTSTPVHNQEVQALHRVQKVTHSNVASLRPHKATHSTPTAPRGRRRTYSSPVFSPLVVRGDNYNQASPSVKVCPQERGRVQFNRFHPTSR